MHTSLDVPVLIDIPLDTSAEFITVVVRNWCLSVQCPVRVAILLQPGICPVLDINVS